MTNDHAGEGIVFTPDALQSELYYQLCRGDHAHGPRGRIVFCVSTIDLAEGKGDIYVASGLAKYLQRMGWGVSFWPIERWAEPLDSEVDVAIVMIESFVPGLVDRRTKLVAWVRNWTDRWADSSYLDEFDAIWASSSMAARRLSEKRSDPIPVVPIGVDLELFSASPSDDRQRDLDVVTTANYWGAERDIEKALAALALHRDVTWFGANNGKRQPTNGIAHRGLVDFFALPHLYGCSKLVIDDLIPPAKAYGSQNSRLFEAIASGAVPVTNSERGLSELGLASVPSYSAPEQLVELTQTLLEDDGRRSRLAAELRAVVHERHSYEARAERVSDLLIEMLATNRAAGPRSSLLAWSTALREEIRSVNSVVDRQNREIVETHARLAQAIEYSRELETQTSRLRAELQEIKDSRTFQFARKLSAAAAPMKSRRTSS
jgi:glycosyltransferase involved in cell wall biosynthesis